MKRHPSNVLSGARPEDRDLSILRVTAIELVMLAAVLTPLVLCALLR